MLVNACPRILIGTCVVGFSRFELGVTYVGGLVLGQSSLTHMLGGLCMPSVRLCMLQWRLAHLCKFAAPQLCKIFLNAIRVDPGL